MTRPGSGEGPAEGPSGASASAGRHSAPDAAEVAGGAGRAAVERALRERSAGGRRRAAAVVTESDPPGQWNGVGPGALLLPSANGQARPAGVNGHHPATHPAMPDLVVPTSVNGHPPDLDAERHPAASWTEPPPGPAAVGEAWDRDADTRGLGWAVEDDPAGTPGAPVDWWGAPVDTRGGQAGASGDAVDWWDDLADTRDSPPVWPAGPADSRRSGGGRAGWDSPPGPVDSPPASGGPAGWDSLAGPADWRPGRGVDEPVVGGWPTGWHSPPAPNGDRLAEPARIGDLPPPAEDWPPARPNGRPPTGPPPYPAPPIPTAYRPVDRVAPVFDDDATQLLRRYVPAQEMLDREGREPAPDRPPTLPEHPARAVVRRRRTRRRRLEWPFLIVFALLSAYLIRAYVVQTFYIPSGSMHETLLEGDRVLVNKVGFHLHDVHRGDVVVFRRPPDFPVEDEDLIKRVVALPGETVEAHGRQVYVDGKQLTEPYVDPLCGGTQDFPPVTVPAGDLWVMGDNRCNSSDSRVFGPISENLLVGRAFVLAWPFSRLSWL